MINMTKRILAAISGAVLFGILVPILYVLLVGAPQSFVGFVWLAVAGVIAGAALGALLPRVFGFVLEMFLEA